MGNWIFNSGYQSFHNPFPAPPVINHAGTTIINYTTPITVATAGIPVRSRCFMIPVKLLIDHPAASYTFVPLSGYFSSTC